MLHIQSQMELRFRVRLSLTGLFILDEATNNREPTQMSYVS